MQGDWHTDAPTAKDNHRQETEGVMIVFIIGIVYMKVAGIRAMSGDIVMLSLIELTLEFMLLLSLGIRP